MFQSTQTSNPPNLDKTLDFAHPQPTLEKYAKEISKAIRERQRSNNPCRNGVHYEYQQIHESRLLQYLREGWQIVHNLGNGDVIVKR